MVGAHGEEACDVAVDGGRIAALGSRLHGRREIDARGLYVLPGAIDGHVHMRTERLCWVHDDTFASGSVAAAFGGVTTFIDQAQVEPGTSLVAGLEARLAEAEAVYRALAMASVAGVPLLVFHLTAAEAVRELEAARARGQEVYGEVCLPYLLLGEEAYDVPVTGPALPTGPPLRGEEHRNALWDALGRGAIDIVSTDHGPRRSVRSAEGEVTIPPGMYEGWEVTGAPVVTIVRGEVVVADGDVQVEPGHGRFATREPRR